MKLTMVVLLMTCLKKFFSIRFSLSTLLVVDIISINIKSGNSIVFSSFNLTIAIYTQLKSDKNFFFLKNHCIAAFYVFILCVE